MFTCIACKVAFEDASEQRQHFATDWHRYNMKRRVADLPPLPAQAFNEKVLERREQNAVKTDPRSLQCSACSKSFSTENAYRSHIQSKRHRDREAAHTTKATASDNDVAPRDTKGKAAQVEDVSEADNESEEEEDTEEEDIDKKLASYRRKILPSDCLFCTTRTASVDDALSHMSRYHSFFLPRREDLTDISGLLSYLGEKVVIGNLCLYCPNGGKEFGSVAAARKHMIDKAHCKMAYETAEDQAEFMEFYDGGKGLDDEWEDVDMDSGDDTAFISEDGLSLVLPSGRILGHRALKIYYAQRFRPHIAGDTSESKVEAVRKQLADPTQALVPRRGGHGAFGQGMEVMKARNAGEAKWAKKQGSSFIDQRKRADFKTKIGYVGNNQKRELDRNTPWDTLMPQISEIPFYNEGLSA